MIRLTLISVAVISLLGCANHGRPLPADFSGQQLVVNKPILLPADAGSVLFQNGKVISNSQLTIWETHCSFRFKQLTANATTLSTGQYQITGFNYFDEFCDRQGTCDRVNRYDLKTVSGPEAINLTCKYRIDFSTWNAENNPVILSREQVQKTLGDWIKFAETSQ
jgi:hypothetical protein